MDEQIEHGQEVFRETTGMFERFWEKLTDFFPTLIIAFAVFLIGILIARLFTKLLSRTMRRSRINATAAGFGQSFVRILIYSILIIVCLSILGVPTASLITVVGAAGVTIGLALQNTLSNLAGGFIILFAKPFQAGDYIKVSGQEGYVESVSILYTELRMRDHQIVFLPNSIVSSGAVINLSREGTLRVSVPVSVSYDTNIKQARSVILKAVMQESGIQKKPLPTVTVSELGDHGITLLVSAWVKKEQYFVAPPQILECIKTALESAEIEIPFPQIDVHNK